MTADTAAVPSGAAAPAPDSPLGSAVHRALVVAGHPSVADSDYGDGHEIWASLIDRAAPVIVLWKPGDSPLAGMPYTGVARPSVHRYHDALRGFGFAVTWVEPDPGRAPLHLVVTAGPDLTPDDEGRVPCLPCRQLGIAPDDHAATCEYCGGTRRTTPELLATWLPSGIRELLDNFNASDTPA